MFSFREIIDMATQIEKNGERIYQAAMYHTHDNGFKELLQWMADEEASHATWLGELSEKSDNLVSDETLKEMSDALVRDYLKDQAFSLDFLPIGLNKYISIHFWVHMDCRQDVADIIFLFGSRIKDHQIGELF